jgi:Fe-S cluster assembly protein SufD
MRPEIKPMKTAAEAALAEAFAAVRAKLPGDRRIAERRAAAFQAFDALACRTGGSRNGNTPICAR